MVSTRQMSIINGDCNNQNNAYVPVRHTRNTLNISENEHSAPLIDNHQTSEPSTSRVTRQNSYKITERSIISILDFPQEVVEKIFGYLTFKNICELRLVCRKFDSVCGQLLNSTFQKLQNQMLHRFQEIKSKMPRRESARWKHPLACESDIIETLHMRLTLLQMSFGKHIERKHCCFFPGEILDEVYNILHYIKVTPKLSRPYKVTDELFDLSTMAMEYFKEKIEPNLPEIAYFGTDFLNFTGTFSSSGTNKYLALDSSPLGPEEVKKSDRPNDILDNDESITQSNMVLRKRIRKIKQGMKKYNSQLSLLKQDLRSCKRKTAEQQKQIAEQQKQLSEQQKQTLEYASRLDEYDKKNEDISRKFSTLLQELNKCKTELQYWRSKSPATPPFCSSCGNVIHTPPDDLAILMNQGVNPEEFETEYLPLPACSSLEKFSESENEETATTREENIIDVSASVKTTTTTNKRKFEEPKDTPTSAVASNKRRAHKNRGKCAKIV